MSSPASLPPSAQVVTASDLVRRFGEWQRRAALAPVYILHHSRPQFVLASVELMQAFSARGQHPREDDIARILDALAEPVLVVAADGLIVAAGRPARLCFGDRARAGARLDDVLTPDVAAFVTDMVGRVVATGIREQAELPAQDGAPRLELTIEPHPDGAVIAGRAGGVADARDAALAQAQALASALAALPDTALATINPRGYLIAPDDSLARLSGVAARALSGARAVSLFTVGGRVAVGEAIEAAFAGGRPTRVAAELLTRRDAALPVDVALAPLRRGLAVSAVVAVIASRTAQEFDRA